MRGILLLASSLEWWGLCRVSRLFVPSNLSGFKFFQDFLSARLWLQETSEDEEDTIRVILHFCDHFILIRGKCCTDSNFLSTIYKFVQFSTTSFNLIRYFCPLFFQTSTFVISIFRSSWRTTHHHHQVFSILYQGHLLHYYSWLELVLELTR